MTRMTDRIEQVERAFRLEPDPLSRRLAVRKVLKAVTDEAFDAGYSEGMADALDAARQEVLAHNAQQQGGDGSG